MIIEKRGEKILPKNSYNFKIKGRKCREKIHAITQILDEKKAEDIEIFDIERGRVFVSFAVIATTLGEKARPFL